jgi:hypothetical protein
MTRGHADWQPWTAVQRYAGTGGAVPFEAMITVPANTAEASPASQDIALCKGFVARVWIRFPAGSVGLLHVAIYDQSTKIFPGASNQWFSGDNEIIEFETEYDVPLVAGNYKLTIKGYNEDDSYPHSALVRIFVVRLP